MKVRVITSEPEEGFECYYSYEFLVWFERELSKLIKPSKAFKQAYPTMKQWEFCIVVSPKFSKPAIDGPYLSKKDNTIEYFIHLHHDGKRPRKPREYLQEFKSSLEQIAIGLKKVGIEASRLLEDAPRLLNHFVSTPEMIEGSDEIADDDSGFSQIVDAKASQKKVRKKRSRRQKRELPQWNIPKNLQKILASTGEWESQRWDPLLLTVRQGDSPSKRHPTWQIEIPMGNERLQPLRERLTNSGYRPDGHGLTELIEKEFSNRYPKYAGELDSDPEMSTCVVSVESEDACQKLIELVWALIYPARNHLLIANSQSRSSRPIISQHGSRL